VNRPQSLKLKSSEYKVPVNSAYGVVNFNQSSTLPDQARKLNSGGVQGRPVDSIYGVVQPPRATSQQAGPQYPYSMEAQSNRRNGEQSHRPDILAAEQSPNQQSLLPRKESINKRNTSPIPDSSYEFVELPKANSLSRNNHSTPISIPSQNRSLPRDATYDSVVSPPRRTEPIGAPTSPYGNLDFIDKSEEDRKEGDGLARGLPETRSDPEGAKKRDLQSPPTRNRQVPDYENVVLPPRTGSMSSQKETVYENMPVSPATYEYHVPRPQPRPFVPPSTAGEDR
jgi:hypothetical protein